ncbi:MAG: hypothetical protein DMG26_20145 [Acidobacteria bacterium]|nr:MAG: hypothetical protein DMG26_20145 [Acidobacteriota bacterium]
MILANSTDEPARQQAEKEFKLALAADPNDAHSEYMLGEIEWLRSNAEGALKHDEKALALQPTLLDAHIAAGKALTSLGRPDEALKHLLDAGRLDPQNEVTHYRLCQAYRRLGRMEDAEHEAAVFRTLRDSHAPVRALYEQIQQRSPSRRPVSPDIDKSAPGVIHTLPDSRQQISSSALGVRQSGRGYLKDGGAQIGHK